MIIISLLYAKLNKQKDMPVTLWNVISALPL